MTELEPARGGEITALTPAQMPELMRLAVEKGGVEALERLVAMHERMADRMAAQEFAAAMAAFQEECPPIRKTSTAKVVTKSGGSYTYVYAELDEIARTVRPILHKHGLTYSWDCSLSDDSARITVVCTVTHANGHTRQATFTSSTAPLTGSMSKQQEVAAALTFGKRQSLISALGLTTCDPDDDGAAKEPEATVTPEQVDILEALIDQRPAGSRSRLLEYILAQWGCAGLEELPASRFEWLKADLEAKLRAQK
jgi:hypothetical protein